LPPWSGRHAPNHDLAQRRVLEALTSGELHESLVEEPRAA
jgi:hypothetical protein